MTLALYGKSKKRQGSLLLAALLAILVASIGGLAVVTSAFAHHTSHQIVQNCTAGTWSYDADFTGGGAQGTPRRAKVYKNDVLVGTYDFTGIVNVANYHTDSGTLPVAGTITFRVEMFSGSPNFTTNQDGEEPNDVSVSGMGSCSKIIVKKVVTGTGADTAKSFSVDVINDSGSAGESNNNAFSQTGGGPYAVTFDPGSDSGDNFNIREDEPSGGWKLIAKKKLTGDASCDTGTWTAVADDSADSERTVAVSDVDRGETFTVCFKNEYTNPGFITISQGECTVGAAPAWSFHFVAPNTNAGSGGNITVGYKIDGGATQFTSPTAENGNGAKANWHITIPFGGGASITIVSVTTSTGLSWDGVQGADNKTASSTACQPVVITPGVDKYNTSDGTPDLGSSFDYKLKFTVPAGSNTTSAFTVQDPIPASFTVGTVSPTVAPLICSKVGNLVTCTLSSGTAPGDYIATIPVTVNVGAQCGPVINDVFRDNPTDGQKLDSDTVNITGCGSLYFDKKNGVKVGSAVHWTIDVTNPSAISGTLFVYDANTSLISEDCDNADVDAGNDVYKCTVSAGQTKSFVVATTLAAGAGVCTPINVNNTASISGNLQSSDTAEFSQTAQPDASCLKVKKENVSNGNWKITFYNTSNTNLTVDFSDTYEPAGTGTDLDGIASATNCVPAPAAGTTETVSQGCDLGVPANGSVWITVLTDMLVDKCESQTVSNTVSANYNGTPIGVAEGGSLTAVYVHPAHPELCNRNVTVCKIVVGNGDAAVVGPFSYGFDIRPTGLGNVSGSNSATEPNPDTNDTNGTEVCTTKQVPTDKTFDVVEWGSRPGGWMGDAAGYPKYSINDGALLSNNTTTQFAAGSSDVKVTFYNKELPKTKLIQITKYFVGLNGYVPQAGDVPSFTLNPSANTNCEAAVLDAQFEQATVVCTVPADWNGTVDETVPANWVETRCVAEALVKELSGLVREVLFLDPYAEHFYFCNAPVGKITVIKIDNTSDANTGLPLDWDFRVLGSDSFEEDGSINLGGGQYSITAPLANGYTASELSSNSADECPIDGPSGIHGYVTTNIEDGPLNITQPGQEITFVFRNDDCGAVLGTGELHVRKVKDINGNHVLDGSDSFIVYQVRITGPEFPLGQIFNTPVDLFGITEGDYQVEEIVNGNYTVIGLDASESGYAPGDTSVVVTVTNGGSDTVTFYNQPKLSIHAHKFAYTSLNGGANVPALNDDDGWTITVTSVNCGINQSKPTDSNGDAEFNNLPYCTDYVVSENPVNASSPGFVPASPVSISGVTPTEGSGTFVTFSNVKSTDDRPTCTYNCSNIPTPTPSVPTATPTTKPGDPTNTPVPPTATPKPGETSIVGGEKTPGPGSPTPIAPSTGAGVLGGTAGGFNLILILGGLLALTSGLSFMALGRKNRR